VAIDGLCLPSHQHRAKGEQALPTLEFKITVPEGTTVTIAGLEGLVPTPPSVSQEEAIARYWHDYLSDNTRKLFRQAAAIETFSGPGYTLEDIAQHLSLDYESVRSFAQTQGRTARRWRDETGTPEPIRLEWENYGETAKAEGMRTSYHLPPGVADAIEILDAH
jgi:hypothetical protein